MQSATDTSLASDGLARFIYSWLPDAGTPVRGVIHISHGMAEHAARYARLAESLTAAGLAVYAHDHRGHGRTSPEAADRGFFAASGGWALCVADLADMVARARALHPDVPLVLMGHSMGSLFAQDYLGEHSGDVDAAILSGTNGKPPFLATIGRLVARIERLRLGARGKSAIIDGLTFKDFNQKFKPNRTDYDWLSRDEAEVDTYIADPDSGYLCTVQLWLDLLDAVPRFTADRHQQKVRADLPIYLFAGDKDPVGAQGKSVAALARDYEKAGVTDVICKLYADARHETLNETNRDTVTADLLAWIEAHI
jgi:alpha-beta hydrolase superfamily lysophospholipase